MKKFFKAGIVISLLLATTSCAKENVEDNQQMESNVESTEEGEQDTKESVYDTINDMLINIEDYEAVAEIKYISNKNEKTYLTNQKARITGEYKIEVIGPEDVSGTITIYDGDVIYQYNPKNSGEVYMSTEDTAERSELFLTSFIANYMKSMESAVQVGNFDNNSDVTVFETTIPGEHPYINNEKLIVDNKTYKPLELIIFDADNKERIIITFKDFVYNPSIPDSEFEVGK